MKKLLTILLLATCSFTVLAAPLPKLTVILDWFPNPDHGPIIVAKQLGYFKEQGLDVALISPSDPSDAPKMVASKKADVGITYQPEFMEQVDRGLPLIRIGTLIDKPLNSLVVLNDSGIKSLADLKGKRIGSSNASGMSNIMLKTMLKKQGLSERDIEIINVRYNLTQALMSHRVDAVTGVMRNVEVPVMEAKNQDVTAYFPEEHGVPNYSELIFVTHISKANDPRLPHFLAAVKKAVRYMDEHPLEAWQLFAKQYPESNNPATHDAWFATLTYFAESPASIDDEEWLNFAKFMQQNKLIKKMQPMSRYSVALNDHLD